VSKLEGGTVAAIFVRTGQLVQRGAELVRLDQTQSGSDFGSGQAALDALGAKIARLKAKVAGRAPVYPRPSDRASAERIVREPVNASTPCPGNWKTLPESRSRHIRRIGGRGDPFRRRSGRGA
jgi:adhesin transport system membrane fusion protein